MNICENCKKRRAEVSVTKSSGGATRKILLCYECHRTLMESETSDIFEAFSGFLAGIVGMPSGLHKRHDCKRCGTSSTEVLETGYVGCADCYKEFKAILTPYIEKTQARLSHSGKRPYMEPVDLEYNRLIDELNRAKSEGRLEDAAKIIKRLNEIVGGA